MRAYRDDQKFLTFRINVMMWLVVLTFFFLAGSFWYVQAVQAEKFRYLSESNSLREEPVRAKRGLIMDRNGTILADNQPAYSLMLLRSNLKELVKAEPDYRAKMIRFIATTMEISEAELEDRIAKEDKKIPFNQPMAIAEDLTMSQVAELEANRISFPALTVRPVQRRNYRYGTMAAHVLGYIGEATEKDLAENEDLRLGDLVGKKGVELVYDKYLRGKDGARYWVVDSHGRQLTEYEEAAREPVAGKNVYLTLDFELQRRAEQFFIENEMVGSAVALDPRNGEVLAMASSPAFNPNVYSKRFTPEVWKTILSNPFKIEINRAIAGLYSPGSVFKIVVGMAAFENGVITPSTTFHCSGSGVFFGRRFRCWKREGHGAVTWSRAIKVSCDTFFYNAGARLGIEKIHDYAQKLTFGKKSQIDLEGEKAGIVPNEQWARESRKKDPKWYPSETISVSIGQGPLIVTPLQVANMMATIANSGKLLQPHVLRALEDQPGKLMKAVPREVSHVELGERELKAVRDGLWSVVNEPGGTGGRSRIANLDVGGKTGTVQVIAQATWIKSEHLPFKYRDHAWFASFAPTQNPEMVVVVFVEHGGHGGSDAAPLAKQLYEARFKDRLAKKTFDLNDPETLRRLREGELPPPGTTDTALR